MFSEYESHKLKMEAQDPSHVSSGLGQVTHFL